MSIVCPFYVTLYGEIWTFDNLFWDSKAVWATSESYLVLEIVLALGVKPLTSACPKLKVEFKKDALLVLI